MNQILSLAVDHQETVLIKNLVHFRVKPFDEEATEMPAYTVPLICEPHMEEAFLKVLIEEENRDVLRLLCFDDVKEESPRVIILRFVRVVFWCVIKSILTQCHC